MRIPVYILPLGASDDSLANEIHKTAVLFDMAADPNKSFSFENSDIQTVLDYEKSTIEIADHVNTPKSVKDYLNAALNLTEWHSAIGAFVEYKKPNFSPKIRRN